VSVPLWCLLAFALWTLCVVAAGTGGHRVLAVLRGKAKADAWPTHEAHGGPEWYRRAMRAHVNCVENLPVFGAIVLIAHVAGVGSPTFDLACQVMIAARVGQTITHVSSGTATAVNVRFTFYSVQLICMGLMAATIITA